MSGFDERKNEPRRKRSEEKYSIAEHVLDRRAHLVHEQSLQPGLREQQPGQRHELRTKQRHQRAKNREDARPLLMGDRKGSSDHRKGQARLETIQ